MRTSMRLLILLLGLLFPTLAMADAGCGQPITTVYSRTFNQADASGNSGTGYRELASLTGVGNTVRITVAGATSNAVKYDHIAFGLQATGANTTATPIEATFAGASGVTVAAGAGVTATSDWIAVPAFAAGQVGIVVADNDAAVSTMDFASGSGTNTYYKGATASFNQASVSGFLANPNYFVVVKVEAMTCGSLPPPPPPAVVAGLYPFGASYECLGGTIPSPLPTNPQASDTRFQYAATLHGPAQFTLAARGGQVALLGDSIMAKNDPALLPGAYDYGISGLTIPGLINLLSAGGVSSYAGWPGLTSLHQAAGTRSGCRAIVLEIGVNDLSLVNQGVSGWTLAGVEASYQTLVSMLTGPLVIVLPLPEGSASLNAISQQFNTWATSTFASRPDTVILNEWSWMASGNPAVLSPSTCQTAPDPSNGGQPDNVHPVGACALRLMSDVRAALVQVAP